MVVIFPSVYFLTDFFKHEWEQVRFAFQDDGRELVAILRIVTSENAATFWKAREQIQTALPFTLSSWSEHHNVRIFFHPFFNRFVV